MAGERVRLDVEPRAACGTRPSRKLRREGFVPGVLYGSGEPRPFAVGIKELRAAIGGEHGTHAILDVVLNGEERAHHAVLKDYQLDPIRSTILHVDLHEVRLDRPIQTTVGIELVGTPEGVKLGGVLTQMVREANVEALPMAIPDRLELDVSALEIGGQAKIGDVVVPEGATVLDDPDTVVATVAPPRVELPEEVEEEAEEAVEGEEGEAPAEEPAAEAAPEADES